MTATEGTPSPKTIYERFPFLRPIEARGQMPNHVAIIMDGNRRWARKELGADVPAIEGHTQGMHNIIDILRDLRQIEPIRYVTLWAFSPENWERSSEEIGDLMRLFEKGIPMILPDVKAANGRVVHLGRRDRVSPEARVVLEAAETETAGNAGQVVCLGIDWGGQDQQLRVMERFAREYPQGTIPTPEILRQLSDTHLTDGTDIPEIDLVFRTGGDQRTSDIPNARCAEFYSIGANLPDATTTDFVMGLVSYSKRERRHGK